MQSILGALANRLHTPITGGTLPLLGSLSSGRGSARSRQLSTMATQSTIFAIVDRISTGVAAAEWVLYRTAATGKPEDRVRVTTHPALTVWTKPNPFYTQSEFVESMFQHYELTGEWWWIVARSERLNGGGPPVELWVIRPDKMTPIPDPKKFISGYVYSAGPGPGIVLDIDDVIYNKRPDPNDPYRGISPIGSLLIDIEGEAAASQWNTNFFRNGAEPGGLLEFQGELGDDEFKKVVERWRQSHKGINNAHRVGILEGGVKWVPNKYTQREMQFEALRRFSRETFRQAWGFPKPLLGDVEDVNRANAEAAEFVFAHWLLTPRLNKLRTTLNDDFLPMFGTLGEGYEFDYRSVTPPNKEDEREDLQMRVDAAVALIALGFDPAEVLEAFGLPALSHTMLPQRVESSP